MTRRWTGVETRRLRETLRMTVREFAAHLGVRDRLVNDWEAGGANAVPGRVHQSALDDTLNRCTPDQPKYVENPADSGHANQSGRVDRASWGLVVNVDRSDVDLIVDIIAAVNAVIDQRRMPPAQPDNHQS